MTNYQFKRNSLPETISESTSSLNICEFGCSLTVQPDLVYRRLPEQSYDL
nr:hypothetical protein [Paenibacillus nuruki]